MARFLVAAYSFASTFRLRELVPVFGGTPVARIDKDRLVAMLGPERYAFAYDFGALVFVGVESSETERLVAATAAKLSDEPHPPLTETFSIDVAPGAPVAVHFDRVVLPELSLPFLDIVAEVLAQSVAMDYYGDDVAEIEAETDRIVRRLRHAGRSPGRVGGMLKFVGQCIATRNDVLSTLALFDKPEATWENEQLDRLWLDLRHMLEFDDRYRVLDAQLRMFQDNLVLFVDLARQRHTIVLEASVVFLILLEILVMVWQVLNGRIH